MRFHTKIAAFKLLSALPGGSSLYRFCQEKFTKSLVPSRLRVGQKLGVGLRYFEAIERENRLDQFLGGVHLDFGAGWHPTIPLLFFALGVERQYLFDLVPVMEAQTVRQTIDTFLSLVKDPNWSHRSMLRRLPPPMDDPSLSKYFESLGITYCAPYAEVFPSLAGKVELVTSTQVLLHIPREPMRWCFGEIRKCLRPGGLFVATAYLKDLFADRHPELPRYNHLRYSAATWERWINSPLMSFNRFKARDYRELLEYTGFLIKRFDIEDGTAEEMKELEKIKIAPCFKDYSPAELAAKDLFFVAQ